MTRSSTGDSPMLAPHLEEDDDGAAARDLAAAAALRETESELRRRVMAFEAPYVVPKLLGARVAESAEEARLLFDEVKKYLLLGRHVSRPLPMCSAWVDATWHQFVLFTREYDEFCKSCLGGFFHHAPADPGDHGGDAGVTHDEFVGLYRAAYGELPDVWYDSLCLRAETRLGLSRDSDVLSVDDGAERALLFRERASRERAGGEPATRELVCRVSQRARGALEFVASHRCFLIRELPGLNALDERITLTRPLVRYGILRVVL